MRNFRIGRAGKVLPITLDNYRMATGMSLPYVQVRDRRPSYFAVCPMCGNPVLICNLFKMNKDSRSPAPYGRHYAADVAGVAKYDEMAYRFCPLSRQSERPGSRRRRPSDPTDIELYRLMRGRFDLVVRLWERTTGIHVGVSYAERMLGMWRADEGWRYYAANRGNLPFMLFQAAPAQNLVGRYIRDGCALHRLLADGDLVVFESTRLPDWVQVRPAPGGGFVALTFLVHSPVPVLRDDRPFERWRLAVRSARAGHGGDLDVELDLDALDRMADGGAGRDRRLLDVAARVLDPV